MNRLLQIPNYFYPHIGGIEQVARDIADALYQPGDGLEPLTFEQRILCFNEDATDGIITCKREQTVRETVDNVEVTRCGCFAKLASQSLSLHYPAQMKKLLREFSPDTIIFHYPNPFVASFLLPMLPKDTRLIVWWHLDITRQKRLEKLFHSQTLRLLQRADQVVATSPNYIDGSSYLQMVRDKCLVIPNCIRPERLQLDDGGRKRAERIRQQHAGKTICFAVGRHVPYKGMEYLIRVSALLDDSFAILIGGEGPLTDSLRQLAEGDRKIKFLGRIPSDELASYYSACDIFCFPSITKNEAFGIALAEGMYFGKPAVTFSIPGSGVNYVSIDGETGIEVPNGDVKAYAQAIKTLQNDPLLQKKYGSQAEERVKKLFMDSRFSENIKRLLRTDT